MSWFHKDKPATPAPAPVVNPADQIQEEINAQSENLRLANVAIGKAAEQVRSLEREKEPLVADIAVIEKRNDPNLAGKLQSRKDSVAALDARIATAKSDLAKGQENYQQFHNAIEQTKQQAQTLGIELDLAHVNQQAAAFQAQLKGYNSGAVPSALDALQSQIRDANAHATVDRAVSTDPNAARDAEYLNAGSK